MHVLGRLYRIFLRYADCNMVLDRPGRDLRDDAGRMRGRVDRVAMRGNRLIVEGWTTADRVELSLGRVRIWTVPELARSGSDERGFAFDLPFEAGMPALVLEDGGEAGAPIPIAGISPARLRRARARMVLRYVYDMIRLLPVIWRWKRRGDLGAREIVKEELGLVPKSEAVEMQAGVFGPPRAVPDPAPSATIVLPVYNAFDLLPDVLDRVARHSGDAWRMVVVEDASPDARVRPYLEAWAAAPEQAGRVRLLLNEANKGFIGTVNRALDEARAHWPDDPVVLLNSDAFVPEGWLGRLLAPLSDPAVATVTPMSNDAEIFTVPVICQRNALEAGQADALDRVAARLDPQAALADAPTGVGFCMALAPQFLRQIPQLDTVFGRGYGEETDWCQKARALGGRNVCTAALFVEHRGGESFGSADKQKLLERNGAVISKRYPSYDQEVQDFIRNDPLNTVRLALGLAWAALRQNTPVPVYLAHAMGGGAESYLRARIARETAAGGAAVVVRVGQGFRWKVELHSAQGLTQGLTNDFALVQTLIDHLPARRVIYSCGVGAYDPLLLPEQLLALAGRMDGGVGHPVDVLIHDFYPVSPSYTLLGKDGVYHGVPVAGSAAAADPAHRCERPGLPDATLTDWQTAWRPLMAAAGRVVVFSENSRRLVTEAYPETAPAIEVIPHPLPQTPPRITPPIGGGAPVIGVLGNIGVQKGAAVLQQLSRYLARNPVAQIVVIGNLDPDYALSAPARVHGSYELRDLPGLVARYGITAWMIPSVWPETFSFTTHEALATGLPVLSFDLGAQGDTVGAAVAAGAPGAVLSLPRSGPVDAAALAEALVAAIQTTTGPAPNGDLS